MSTRPQISPYPVIVNGNMATNLTSLVTVIQKLSMVSYGLSWSAAATGENGTVSVQVSNDYSVNGQGSTAASGTWNTMVLNYNGTTATVIPISGATGSGFIDIDQTAAYAMRLIYSASGGGMGSLQVTLNAKVT